MQFLLAGILLGFDLTAQASADAVRDGDYARCLTTICDDVLEIHTGIPHR